MSDSLSNITKILLDDDKFLKTLEGQIKYIMHDGKVDTKDIPEVMIILTECYNNLGKIKVTNDELPDLFHEIIYYVINKYNLLPDDEVNEFMNMIEMGIKLIMIKPIVRKGCSKFWSKCKKLLCCK